MVDLDILNTEDFTLDKYLSGDYTVVTRDMHSVRIICTDRVGECPIVFLVSKSHTTYCDWEDVLICYSNGHLYPSGESLYDLMLIRK